MKCAMTVAIIAMISTPAFADEKKTATAPNPPTVTLTREELAQHEEEVRTLAVLNYMATEAMKKAQSADAKISSAFPPPAPPASSPAPEPHAP